MSWTRWTSTIVETAPSFGRQLWTDGWLEKKFSHYRWRDQEAGILTYIGDKIRFQNGFGAWQNHVYECDVTIPGSRPFVLEVRAQPGRL